MPIEHFPTDVYIPTDRDTIPMQMGIVPDIEPQPELLVGPGSRSVQQPEIFEEWIPRVSRLSAFIFYFLLWASNLFEPRPHSHIQWLAEAIYSVMPRTRMDGFYIASGRYLPTYLYPLD